MDVHGYTVRGVDVGPETRCRHYDSELDVIAIRFACCGTFYPCYECHLVAADHEAERWDVDAEGSADRADAEDESASNRGGDTPAVLCGICGTVLTISAYLDSGDRCPSCGAEFNPGCRRHYDRYFTDELVADKS